jgi:hypothetical protein
MFQRPADDDELSTTQCLVDNTVTTAPRHRAILRHPSPRRQQAATGGGMSIGDQIGGMHRAVGATLLPILTGTTRPDDRAAAPN